MSRALSCSIAVVCWALLAPLACTAPPPGARSGGSGGDGAGGSSAAGLAGASGSAGPGGASGGSGTSGLGGTSGGSGTSGLGGTSGGPGDPTSVPAGPRREAPGDTEWPQLAYSPVNTSTTTGRIPETPQPLFDTVVDGEIAYTVPVVGEGKLFYELYPGGMVALDAGTGALLWQNKEIGNGKYGTAAYADGRVFTLAYPPPTYAWTVMALDAKTGAMLWSAPADSVGILKVDRGTVYLTAGHVIALDAATGAVRWTSSEACQTPPAIDGDRVYCLGGDKLVALDAVTGAIAYVATTDPASAYSAPAVANGRIFYIGQGLHARAIGDGAAVWNADFVPFTQAELGNLTQNSPAVAYGKVIVIGPGGVFAFDAGNGTVVWKAAVAPRQGTSAAIADGRVVLAGVTLLDVDDGRVLWSAPGNGPGTWTPIVTDGHLYGGGVNHIFGWGGAVPGLPPAY